MSPDRTDAKVIVADLPIDEADPWQQDVITERLPRLPLSDLETDEAAGPTAAGDGRVRVLLAAD
jgi:hypothetical protein